MKLLLQEKQAGNNSNIFNDEIVAVVDKLLEYNCKSTKQHKLKIDKCLNEMKKMKLIETFENVNKLDTVLQK